MQGAGMTTMQGAGSSMSVDEWLKAAIADAERRGMPELKPILESMANAARALRDAGVGGQANGPTEH
jgi:hypothetical protein